MYLGNTEVIGVNWNMETRVCFINEIKLVLKRPIIVVIHSMLYRFQCYLHFNVTDYSQ